MRAEVRDDAADAELRRQFHLRPKLRARFRQHIRLRRGEIAQVDIMRHYGANRRLAPGRLKLLHHRRSDGLRLPLVRILKKDLYHVTAEFIAVFDSVM